MQKSKQKMQEEQEMMMVKKEKTMRSKSIVLCLLGILAAVGMIVSFSFPYSTTMGVAAESSASDSAVTPEFKEFMDGYETTMNGYVDFMKKYANAGEDELPSMLSDYNDWLSQYADWVGKIDAVDQDSLSAADLAYYLEVKTRVLKKLAEVSDSDDSSTSGTTTAAGNSTVATATTTVATATTAASNSGNGSSSSSSSGSTNTDSVSHTADVGICAVVLGAVATAALAVGAVTITRRKK